MIYNLIKKIRILIFRCLGIDYVHLINNLDYIRLDKDKSVNLGLYTYHNGALAWHWKTDSRLTIGKFCSIARDVNFILDEANHNLSKITAYPLHDRLFRNNEMIECLIKNDYLDSQNKHHSIHIGHDVWIGIGCIILPGVKIGNGVTVAAGSVVTNDLEDYIVAGGVPAKKIKDKCTQDKKDLLNKIKWWDWDRETIKSRISDFSHLSISEFIKKYNLL